MEPLISVIMPVYNAEATLGRALASLEAQTLGFDALELIIADDRSADRSPLLIGEFARAHNNVKTALMPCNSGFAGAPRNAALELARAPYVMFLDADDAYTPRACEALLGALESSRADIAGGYFSERSDADGSLAREISDDYARAPQGLSDLTRSLTPWRPLADAMWCKIYRREMIENNGLRFKTGMPGEDVIFLAEYLCCCRGGFYLREKVVDYYVKELSVSHGPSARFFELTPLQLSTLGESLSRRGRGGFYREFIEGFAALDYYLGRLIAESGAFGDAELAGILAAWGGVCSRALDEGWTMHGPLVRILARACAVRPPAGAAEVCRRLNEAGALRARERNGIFSSRSWRAAARLTRAEKQTEAMLWI